MEVETSYYWALLCIAIWLIVKNISYLVQIHIHHEKQPPWQWGWYHLNPLHGDTSPWFTMCVGIAATVWVCLFMVCGVAVLVASAILATAITWRRFSALTDK